MKPQAKEFLDYYVRIPLRAEVKDTDTFAEGKRKIAIYRELDGTDMASIKLAAGSERQELLDKLNGRNCVPVNPRPESVYDVAEREKVAKEVRRRASLPVIDLTKSPEENERTLRRLDAEDARRARSGITDDDDDDDEAQEVRRPEDAPGTVADPVDLTGSKKRPLRRIHTKGSRKARR